MYTCYLCDKKFKSKPALNAHKRKHTEYKPKPVVYCCSILTGKEIDVKQLNNHHEKNLKKLKECPACGTKHFKPKFCSQSCSANYNNKGIKRQTSDTKTGYCCSCGTQIKMNKRANSKKSKCSNCKNPSYCDVQFCQITGLPISQYKNSIDSKWYNPRSLKTTKRLAYGFNIKLGEPSCINLLEQARDDLFSMYHHQKICSKELSKMFGINDVNGNFQHFLKQLNIPIKEVSKARNEYISIYGVNNTNNQYKTGYHISWDKKEHFFRSSYEETFMKILDIKRIKYDSEAIRLEYYDTQLKKYRIAVPDIVTKNNVIFEIKSNYTYDKNNLKDKFRVYKQNKFRPFLVLEGKLYFQLPNSK